jgi:hypothetical protein
LKELKLYEMYSLRHLSCHHLWSEHVEVEGMDRVKKQDHPTNHRLGEEGMNIVDSNIVEVEGMDTVEEHFHPMNNQPEVEGMDTVEDHFHPMNYRPEVEGMNTVDTGMGEDRAAELEVVEREPEDVVLTRHCTDDGVARHHRTHREWEDLIKLGCLKDQPTFITQDSNCNSL